MWEDYLLKNNNNTNDDYDNGDNDNDIGDDDDNTNHDNNNNTDQPRPGGNQQDLQPVQLPRLFESQVASWKNTSLLLWEDVNGPEQCDSPSLNK